MRDDEWLSRRYYGGDLPAEAERALHQAALSFSDQPLAESHLRRAWDCAPGHLAVSIGAYKFYLYHHRLVEAVPYAEACLVEAARRLGLAEDWRLARPDQADFSSLDAEPRLFLFSLFAWGYLLIRLGRRAEGRQALVHLLTLDPADKLGVTGLLAIVDQGEPSES
ncbi:MAG TPA: hypothetical protein VN809_09560 [Telmatospirillum sp.]|nr:hypothetical protein [Telmatospirillum sp.]